MQTTMNTSTTNLGNTISSDEQGLYEKIILANDVFGFLAFLATGTTSVLILSYLHNVSLAKEGLILYLYRDFVTILITLRALWAIKWLLNHLEKSSIKKFPTKLLMFCLYGGILSLALVMNLISALRLFIAKQMMLDPTLPWIGENQSKGITKIRVACALLVVGFLVTMFGLGLYPKMYYGLIEQQVSESEGLIADILFRGILGFLMVTCLATWIGTMFHERVYQKQLDTMIPRTINYFLWIAVSIVGFTLLGETLEILDFRTRWNIYQFLITAGEIIIAFAIILKSEQLKSHSTRFVKNRLDDAFLFSIISVPTVLVLFIYGLLFIIYNIINF